MLSRKFSLPVLWTASRIQRIHQVLEKRETIEPKRQDPHEIHMMLSSFDPCVVHLPGWSFAGLVSCGCSSVTIRSFRGYTGYTSPPWCQNRYFIFSRPHFKLLHLLLLSIDLKTRRTTDAFHQDSNSSVPIFAAWHVCAAWLKAAPSSQPPARHDAPWRSSGNQLGHRENLRCHPDARWLQSTLPLLPDP